MRYRFVLGLWLLLIAAAAQTLDKAYTTGYRDGFTAGQSDQQQHLAANAHKFSLYQQGTGGFTPSDGDAALYRTRFQSGFADGYNDAYAARHNALEAGSAPAPAGPVVLPAGETVHAVLNTRLDTRTSHVGEAFSASVDVPLWAGTKQVIPAGSLLHGTIVAVQRGGWIKGRATIALRYTSVDIPTGAHLDLQAQTTGAGDASAPVSEGAMKGQSSPVARDAGIDAAVGGTIGGIFDGYGGLVRGSVTGAALGATRGLFDRKRDITINPGTNLVVEIRRPIVLQPENLP